MKFFWGGLLLFIVQTTFCQVESIAITGKLEDEESSIPIAYAKIYLPDLEKVTLSDDLGFYSFSQIPEGNYVIKISSLGYLPITDTIRVDTNQLVLKNFYLEKSSYELQTVEVTGRINESYQPDISFSATKTAKEIKDIPQSIQVVNKELMEDQQVFTVDEVMENVSGINNNLNGNSFQARGFNVSMDNINGNKVLGGDESTAPFTQHLERVEVVKGPASVLFGISAPGAVINAVTKKPLSIHRFNVNFSLGSWSTFRSGLDVTGPLNTEKTLLYRLNLGYQNSGSFRDFVRKRSYIVVPSFSYVPNKNTRVNIELIFTKADNTVFNDQGIQIVQNSISVLPINYNTAEPYDFQKNEQLTMSASFSHKFSERFAFNASTSNRSFDQNTLSTRSTHTFSSDGTAINRKIDLGKRLLSSSFVTGYFSYQIKSEKQIHEVVIGGDYFNTDNLSYRKTALGEEDGVPVLSFYTRTPKYVFDQAKLTYSLINGGGNQGYSYWGTFAQYSLERKKINVLVGGRYNHYRLLQNGGFVESNHKTEVFIPRLGVVYKVNKSLNAFASYSQGYQPITIPLTPNDSSEVRIFDPLESFQYEIGFKSEFFKKRLSITSSVFQIKRTGRVVVDPTIDPSISGVAYENLIQLNREYIRGFELDAVGSISRQFQISGNFAYTEIDVQDNQAEKFQEDLESNNPKFTAGFFWKYSFKNKPLNGFSIVGGVNYTSNYTLVDRVVFLGGKPFDFPGYTIFNAGIFYKYDAFRLSLNVKNVTNKLYYRGAKSLVSIYPGAPLNFLVKITYSIV